ncbi:MAG: glycosyltransferase [Paludibaculum sp.]
MDPRTAPILILGEWPDGSASNAGGPRKFNRRLCETLAEAGIVLQNPRKTAHASGRFGQLIAILQSVLLAPPAIVHVTTDGFHVAIALLCKLLWKARIVYSVHSLVRVWPEVRLSTPRIDRVRRWIVEATMVRFCDCAVFPSQHYRAASVSAGYRFHRCETVHHGADTELTFTPRTVPPAPICFAVFGPALKVKGIERIHSILEELRDIGVVRWIGYDPADPLQMTEVVRQLSERCQSIQFDAPVPPGAVNTELKTIAITLMPSEQESFGIIALESAAAGVPVIVSSATGAAELIGSHQGGAVVTGRTPGEYRRAAIQILENYPNASASAIDCARVYSWSRAADGYFAIYQSLMNRIRPSELEAPAIVK